MKGNLSFHSFDFIANIKRNKTEYNEPMLTNSPSNTA